MNNNSSYTIEEVSQLLKISKLTVYDLIKKEELVAFRVGRQMRVDQQELERYKLKNRTGSVSEENYFARENRPSQSNQKRVVISGQDVVLDMLSKYVENHTSLTPLRSYTGSLNSLISMYHRECDVVSVHLFDGDTGEYNLPYVKRILVSQPFILINLVCRMAGIYVKQGNPLNIKDWRDLAQPQVTIVNREKGSGARVLLDENLRIHGIPADLIKGYENELTSHFSVASTVASGQADAGIGTENVAKMVNVDFIPLIQEHYDLVILKTKESAKLIDAIKEAVCSKQFLSQLEQLNGYDLKYTGKIKYESF